MGSRFAHLIVTINGRIAKKKQTTKVCDLFHGGDDRDRTDYLLNAIQALSQVSYAPIARLSRGCDFDIISRALQKINT